MNEERPNTSANGRPVQQTWTNADLVDVRPVNNKQDLRDKKELVPLPNQVTPFEYQDLNLDDSNSQPITQPVVIQTSINYDEWGGIENEPASQHWVRVNPLGVPLQFIEAVECPGVDFVLATGEMVEDLQENPFLIEDYRLQENGTFAKTDSFSVESKPWEKPREPSPLVRSSSPEGTSLVLTATHLTWVTGNRGRINVTLVDSTNLPLHTICLSPSEPATLPSSVHERVNAFWFPVSDQEQDWPDPFPSTLYQVSVL